MESGLPTAHRASQHAFSLWSLLLQVASGSSWVALVGKHIPAGHGQPDSPDQRLEGTVREHLQISPLWTRYGCGGLFVCAIESQKLSVFIHKYVRLLLSEKNKQKWSLLDTQA